MTGKIYKEKTSMNNMVGGGVDEKKISIFKNHKEFKLTNGEFFYGN
jgi:hypothetical protein